ncbi:MAG: hypothetical protein HY791_21685 [Deltaproteobacteria bacterium]|nr:hypothetical protein [Deltaproteobacteria bacterium]
MQAHKLKVNVSDDHRVTFTLPDAFPRGEAEVIVLTLKSGEHEGTAPPVTLATTGAELLALLSQGPARDPDFASDLEDIARDQPDMGDSSWEH